MKIPFKKNLGLFPTPIHELKNLSKYLNAPKIFIKRDDLTGLALGGNKIRKLEYLIGDALLNNCDTIITGGSAQSNHCRQTAAAASIYGLECHLALGGEEPNLFEGNLLLDKLLGAVIHWSGVFRKGEKIPQICKELISMGKKPYIIPYGGSNEIGVWGFINAVKELKIQIKNLKEEFTHIVFPSSSGGTHAGFIIGKSKYNLSVELIGIQIDKGTKDEFPYIETLLNLLNSTSQKIFMNKEYKLKDIILFEDYVGEGYGIMNDLDIEAIKLLSKFEGILLDPVYTGRAMGGLIDLVKKKYFSKDDKILFWHTGGIPALFTYSKNLMELSNP